MFEAGYFDPSYKLRVHLIQIFLVIVGIIIAVVALSVPSGFMTRAVTVAMSMLITGHVARFSKWKSLKAYAILNCIESVIWIVAFVMTIQSNNRICTGVTCPMSKFLAANAFFIEVLMVWAAICSVIDWRHFKSTGYERGTSHHTTTSNSK
ncbi:hypothetical protein DL767_003991 [Monosporascus sp. MG133]|nr:hypothetical protein DL767_003991 [Monosporascus sp. MG133]